MVFFVLFIPPLYLFQNPLYTSFDEKAYFQATRLGVSRNGLMYAKDNHPTVTILWLRSDADSVHQVYIIPGNSIPTITK